MRFGDGNQSCPIAQTYCDCIAYKLNDYKSSGLITAHTWDESFLSENQVF